VDWQFEAVAGPFGGPTGAAVWDGEALLFSVLPDGPILRYDPRSGQTSEFRRHTHRIAGLAFAPDGVLFGCQPSSRRLVRLSADGSMTPMINMLDGRCQNYPEDLTVDRQGRIWFSDPYSTIRAGGPQLHGPLDHASVLRLDPLDGGWKMHRVTYDTTAPAAVALSADERTLYVSENSPDRKGTRELRAYPIEDDGSVGPYVVLHTFAADARGAHRGVAGMCLDADGRIAACAGWNRSGPGPLVYVFDPSGRVLETHSVPGNEPNRCVFGDADLGSLYVTGGDGCVYRARDIGRRGLPRFAGAGAAVAGA